MPKQLNLADAVQLWWTATKIEQVRKASERTKKSEEKERTAVDDKKKTP